MGLQLRDNSGRIMHATGVVDGVFSDGKRSAAKSVIVIAVPQSISL
jgi:hypothetical protein